MAAPQGNHQVLLCKERHIVHHGHVRIGVLAEGGGGGHIGRPDAAAEVVVRGPVRAQFQAACGLADVRAPARLQV